MYTVIMSLIHACVIIIIVILYALPSLQLLADLLLSILASLFIQSYHRRHPSWSCQEFASTIQESSLSLNSTYSKGHLECFYSSR